MKVNRYLFVFFKIFMLWTCKDIWRGPLSRLKVVSSIIRGFGSNLIKKDPNFIFVRRFNELLQKLMCLIPSFDSDMYVEMQYLKCRLEKLIIGTGSR